MNREDRRRLQRIAKRRAKKSDGEGVQLEGGPMDGWFVTADAPALQPEWGAPHGGKYVHQGPDDAGIHKATWEP